MRFGDPWDLRAGVRFLEEVTEALYAGGAWVISDASLPPGLTDALEPRLKDDRWLVSTSRQPAKIARWPGWPPPLR